jgi:catechol 2,3-dioxygenase-like lactoylglutathione lyase family enzyme
MLSDHPVFPVILSTDLAISRDFYRDTIGLELLIEGEDRLVFRCGGGSTFTVSLSTVGTSDTQTQMVWRVPDLAAEIADLRARGVRIEDYDTDDLHTEDGVADMGWAWAAWFVDPMRNALGIAQPKSPPGALPRTEPAR